MRILNDEPTGGPAPEPTPTGTAVGSAPLSARSERPSLLARWDRREGSSSRSAAGPLAVAAIGAAILAILGNGVDATLSALTEGDRSPEITSGTLLLTLDDVGVGFSTDVTDLAPGDVVERFVDVTNAGSLDTDELTMELSAAGDTVLITDGAAPSTTKAVTIAIDRCSIPWDVSPSSSTCAGTLTSQIAAAPLGSVVDTVSTVAPSLAAGDLIHLRVRVSLPDQDETSINGNLPTPTVQGRSVTVTATFRADQREATTTSS
jgi:hypothetical protein